MIEKIKIENLTVFEDLEIDTSAPINVFIGENGTGKTQILKFIYMILNAKSVKADNNPSYFGTPSTFGKAFLGDEPRNFIRPSDNKKEPASMFIISAEKGYSGVYKLMHSPHLGQITDSLMSHNGLARNSVFIPAKDMLTHSKGLPSMKKDYGENMPFDETYINIIEKAGKWNKQKIPQIAKEIVPILEGIMDGVVEIDNEVFFIRKHNGQRIRFDLEAEGVKKIGLLWQLLMSETIVEGTILLWDEPDANLNPNLASTIAHMLLELSRNGVQIFLSTHSYFLPKYFDLLEKDKKEVVFHSLYRENDDKNSPVICETSDTFTMLRRNSILGEIVELFEREMEWE